MKDKLNKLQELINIKFVNLDLLERSLIHKSSDKNINNEKLEFLGDRVLGLVLSKNLLEIYPNEKEGIIDKKFANLVNKTTCAKIASLLNLKKFIELGSSYRKGGTRSDAKITSDALEALIGAIFLDQGLDVSEKFILKNWSIFLKKSSFTKIDSKTKLQEYSLKKYKKLPEYKMQKVSGPQHNPIFKVDVKIPNSKIYLASGRSKKEAQQEAAKKLLKDLEIKI
jgi:ribonuclease-3